MKETMMVPPTVPTPKRSSTKKANMTDYSNIPNAGASRQQRRNTTLIGGSLGLILGMLMVEWPSTLLLFSHIWGPFIMMGLIAGGIFLIMQRKKDPFELAIMEFDGLGFRPETIGSVIIENRAKAYTLLVHSDTIISDTINTLINDISSEVLDIINGFHDDPSDLNRSRSTLTRCLDQAGKIVEEYEHIERRKDTMGDGFIPLQSQTELGLVQIRDALIEQHKRNLDNNTSALEVDLEVSDQLLKTLKS